jgi:Peptide methionine sulfoxide reductase
VVTQRQIHDPTLIGHKGSDIGEQYRLPVFTHGAEETRLALGSRAREQRSRATRIATDVVPAGPFYLAEPYQQRLCERGGGLAPGRFALSALMSWLALSDPEDPSVRNGVAHEPGNSRRQ